MIFVVQDLEDTRCRGCCITINPFLIFRPGSALHKRHSDGPRNLSTCHVSVDPKGTPTVQRLGSYVSSPHARAHPPSNRPCMSTINQQQLPRNSPDEPSISQKKNITPTILTKPYELDSFLSRYETQPPTPSQPRK